MKYRVLFLMTFLIGYISAQTNSTGNDTIFCDTKNTSYMVFAEDVSLCDVGYPEDYAAQVKGNIVFVKALKQNIAPTTVLIKTGRDIYFGMLKYKTENKRYYYDFKQSSSGERTIKPNTNGQEAEATKEKDLKSSTIKSETVSRVLSTDTALKAKMLEFIKTKNEIATLGFVSPTLDASVSVIRNDHDNTYLKLILKNKSSIPYKLDFISFQYYQDMIKGALRKSKKAPIDVFPVGEPGIKEVAAGKTELLPYVIPAFALANNGYLMLLIRESSGDRVLKIKINGSLIQSSPQLVLSNGK